MTDTPRSRTITWDDPMIAVNAAKTMSGLDRLKMIMSGAVPRPPMAVLVGIEMTECEAGRVVFEGEPAEYHYNLGGVAHGGYACALLDSALGCAITSVLPAGRSCTTTDLHVRFLRPLTTATGRIRCEAKIIHVGRTIGTAEARITDAAARIYAHATTACAILRENDD